jgi:signal transduction histidine kinase
MTNASTHTIYSPWREIDIHEHVVQFLETDADLISSVAAYVETGLNAGDACIVVATQSHREALERRLADNGLDLAGTRRENRYLDLDAMATLAQFTINGEPQSVRFGRLIGNLIQRASANQRRVRIFGEMVALLWAAGYQTAAISLEDLWNKLGKQYVFSLFCAYPVHDFAGKAYEQGFAAICQQHNRVIFTASPPHETADERQISLAQLEQKVHTLEAEIAERQKVEEHLRALVAIVESSDDAMLHRDLTRRNAQIERLTALLNDLLDVSKIQAGLLVYQEEAFAIDQLVEEIVEHVQKTTGTHQIQREGETGALLYGDRKRIGQALTHLLANAIKYAPRSSIIRVHLTNEAQHILLIVQDAGPGIAREHQARIFELFYQVMDDEGKTYPGLGIGLYISNEIVKRHHGQLRVESEKGQGATFYLRLPVLVDTRETEAGEPE